MEGCMKIREIGGAVEVSGGDPKQPAVQLPYYGYIRSFFTSTIALPDDYGTTYYVDRERAITALNQAGNHVDESATAHDIVKLFTRVYPSSCMKIAEQDGAYVLTGDSPDRPTLHVSGFSSFFGAILHFFGFAVALPGQNGEMFYLSRA